MIDIFEYGKDDISKLYNRKLLDEKDDRYNVVELILNDVRKNGDDSLFKYIKNLDKLNVNKDNFIVSEEEINNAFTKVDEKIIQSLYLSKDNILNYHIKQKQNSLIICDGESKVGWIVNAVNRAGIYIPGGKAAYPSSVLMVALPAVAAGVKEIYMATPNLLPLTLVAANICGVKTIYKMGGAQAIAALAYGTESVKKVDIIAGPGNSYVTIAKKLVYGDVNIDMLAGPSEILVIADNTAKPNYVAADLLSQAEHDEEAASILITSSMDMAIKVKEEIIKQTAMLSRKNIIKQSLQNYGGIVVVENLEDAVNLSNTIAPEHLEICVENADALAMQVKNAGAIFIGNYSPEALGDYFAGPSHTLPTSGSSRYFSVLNTNTFQKKISYINYSRDDLLNAKEHILKIANEEGFTAHANSVSIRE